MKVSLSNISTRTKLVVALIVVVAVIGTLIRTAVTSASTYYLTVSELHKKGLAAIGEGTTVSGNIVGKSVQWDPQAQRLTFSIVDDVGATSLPVEFHGAKPDDFANDWPVIVSGSLQKNGVFQADKLLIKCPSKYKAQEKTYSAMSS